MKLRRILAMPFCVVADLAMLPRTAMGQSFTEDLFTAERREQRFEQELRAVQAVTELAKAMKND